MKKRGLFIDNDGKISIEIKIIDDSIWLSLNQIVDSYQSSKSNTSEHIKNIFNEEALNKKATVRNFRTVL